MGRLKRFGVSRVGVSLLIGVFLFYSNQGQAGAAIPVFELKQDQAVRRAHQESEKLRSAEADLVASREQAEASFTALLPRLTLDGNYRYIGVIPSITIPAVGLSVPFGTNSNYSIGPTLSYTLWDSGSAQNSYKSQLKLVESRDEDRKNTRAQLTGSVKTAYVQVQLALEQLRLVQDTLRLSRAQDQDITNRFRAGTATRLDLLTAHRDVLSYELQFKQQQSNLSGYLRDLLTLIEDHSSVDVTRPGLEGYEEATVWLKLESLDQTMQYEARGIPNEFGENSPQIKSQELLGDSLMIASESQWAQAYPQIQISARTSLDYPNGPIIQNINQNILTATFSMPLFEFDRTRHLAAEKMKEADSVQHRKNQLQSNLSRDFLKAKELLSSLQNQQKDAEESVKQSEILEQLSYESYTNGRITLVDVQAANVRALQAKFDLARIRAQLINEIVILKTLVGQES